MQRNKTVSNFHHIREDRKRINDINSRTLKENKSIGHILRKDKKDNDLINKERDHINLKNKEKINLKYRAMTPKRTEKKNSFYTKTDVRCKMNENRILNLRKIDKKKKENSIFKGKEDTNKKIINLKEKQIKKKLDIKVKANKRPSRQNIIEKNKNDIKKIEKLKDKANENKSKIEDKKNNMNKDNKNNKNINKKENDINKNDKDNLLNDDKKEKKTDGNNYKEAENDKFVIEKKNIENKKEEKVEIKEEEKYNENLNKEREQEIKNVEKNLMIGKEDKIKIKDKNNQIKIEPIEKKEIIKTKLEQNNKLSKYIFHRLINFYDKINKFLNDEEKKNLILISKDSALAIIPILKEINTKKIQESQNTLNQFKLKNKEEDYKSKIPPFQLGKAGLKALEKLNEDSYHKLFLSEEVPNKDIIFIYRLFLQLINKQNQVEIKNDKEFWEMAKNIIYYSKKDKFGDHIKEMIQQINLSDENLAIVDGMCKKCMEKLTPKYYNSLCSTTPLFFLLIKEILEYCGILLGKKTPIPMEYKKLEYDLKIKKEKDEKLNKIAEMAHKKKSLFKKID